MCGICGVNGFDSQQQAAECVRRMMDAMVHRGPDGEGLLAVPRAAIGMRRLSIIDLPSGNQPIWNETGTLALVFNGEIYNFRELRRSLETAGHAFRTQSDTEVIVHAYEAWGENCVRHLRGMFAFAILEMPEGRMGQPRRIFLARDRLGIKPLYYAESAGKFFFASEVAALLSSGYLPRQISRAAIQSYLQFGSVCEPETLVEGIFSLPPGHCGFISCETPSAFSWSVSFWNLGDVLAAQSNDSPEAAPASLLKEKLEESVRCHLEADVPLGIFLSSGLDSTALATLASRQRRGVSTFTVVFPEQEFNESEIARQTARRLGTSHTELLLSGDEMCVRLDEAVNSFDQPSMDGVNTFFVSWAAHKAGLKVALSGLGSDELFGGYDTFRLVPRLLHLTAFSRALPAPIRKATSFFVDSIASRKLHADASRKLVAAFSRPNEFPHPYFFTRVLFPPQITATLLRPDHGPDKDPAWYESLLRNAQDSASLDSFTAVSWLETRSYLLNTLLRDTDTMSMRHSLEVRVPFLDHPLVEWALLLPADAKKNGMRKALLIEALGDLLPREVVAQPKRTFTLPWENWLRGPLRARVESSLNNLSPALLRVLDEAVVKKIWSDFIVSRTSWSRPWSLFVLNEWTRRIIDAAAQGPSQEEAKVANATA